LRFESALRNDQFTLTTQVCEGVCSMQEGNPKHSNGLYGSLSWLCVPGLGPMRNLWVMCLGCRIKLI